jgi:hypothetical protein
VVGVVVEVRLAAMVLVAAVFFVALEERRKRKDMQLL